MPRQARRRSVPSAAGRGSGLLALSESLLCLHEALARLAEFDARKARVVELRYFAGMSVEEAAETLGVHPNTVIHDWTLAKAWLKREFERSARDESRTVEENR